MSRLQADKAGEVCPAVTVAASSLRGIAATVSLIVAVFLRLSARDVVLALVTQSRSDLAATIVSNFGQGRPAGVGRPVELSRVGICGLDPADSVVFGFSGLDETPIFSLESAKPDQTPPLRQNAWFEAGFGKSKG